MWPLWRAWPRGCNAHRERKKTSRAGVETLLAHHLRSIFTLLPEGLGGSLGSLPPRYLQPQVSRYSGSGYCGQWGCLCRGIGTVCSPEAT